MITAGAGTLLANHAASIQAAEAFHSAFQKQVTEFVAFTRTGFVTLMLNNVTTCRNIANNLGRYATTPPIWTCCRTPTPGCRRFWSRRARA